MSDFNLPEEVFAGEPPRRMAATHSLWAKIWRECVAPILKTSTLEALRLALVNDDPRLVQKVTTDPPPLNCVEDWPVEAACLLGYCGAVELGGFAPRQPYQGTRLSTPVPVVPGVPTVKEVEDFFAQLCMLIDAHFGEQAACRILIHFWDDTPREEARRLLLPEVQLALAGRLRAEADSEEVEP